MTMENMNMKYLINFYDILPLRAKIISTVQALNTTKYLSNERDYIPWKAALNNLDFFYLMFDRSEVYGPMQVNFFQRHIHTKETIHK